jgi:hypothetical protein
VAFLGVAHYVSAVGMKHAVTAVKIVGRPLVLADLAVTDVRFISCALAQFDDPSCGTIVVRDVELARCGATSCSMHGVRFEHVTVDGLSVSGVGQLEACLFDRVTLRGRIGPVITTPPNPSLPAEVKQAFLREAEAYYRTVDWALDITAAEFSDADFYMVPGHLVRRDNETQALLRRDVIAAVPPEQLSPIARIWADRFSATPFDSLVAIAPRRSTRFRDYLRAIDELRREGFAE